MSIGKRKLPHEVNDEKSTQIKDFLNEQYDLTVDEVKEMTSGVGGDTYQIVSGQERYIFKLADTNAMNRPEMEPELCDYLIHKGISASQFCHNKEGSYISYLNGACGHLQKYIEGNVYAMNTAPDWFMDESAKLLADVHNSLKDHEELPYGIGQQFFDYMTVERAKESYLQSLRIAKERRDESIVEDLEYRIQLAESFPRHEIRYRGTYLSEYPWGLYGPTDHMWRWQS